MYANALIEEKVKVVPFLKWAGGKRQLLPEIRKYTPNFYKCYFEPFLGAGAVFFDLQPKEAVINDSNEELINCYNVIKNNLEELIIDLSKHALTEDYFYRIREVDRNTNFKDLSKVERASRFIYLNRTCFNGLYRVNSKGYFNVPFGKYKNPNFQNFELLRNISVLLSQNDITIYNNDFRRALAGAGKDDFVYLDPPYDPLNKTSSFTSYQADTFGKSDQIRLKETFDELNSKGCKLMMSNSSTEFIEQLYQDYKIIRVKAGRLINSNASLRGQIDEFLIMNY
jgi:DNA adenine methylase